MSLQPQRKLDMNDTSRSAGLTSWLPHAALLPESSILQRPRTLLQPKQLRSGAWGGAWGPPCGKKWGLQEEVSGDSNRTSLKKGAEVQGKTPGVPWEKPNYFHAVPLGSKGRTGCGNQMVTSSPSMLEFVLFCSSPLRKLIYANRASLGALKW